MIKTNSIPAKSFICNPIPKDTSPGELHFAIWVLRVVNFDLPSDFLSHNLDDFLKYVGDYLVWPVQAIEAMKAGRIDRDDEEMKKLKKLDANTFYQTILSTHANRSYYDTLDGEFQRCMVKKHRPLLRSMLKESLSRLESVKLRNDSITENAQYLEKLLELTATESAILQFAARLGQSHSAHQAMNNVDVRDWMDATRNLAAILALNPADVAQALKNDSRLVEYKLITINRRCRNVQDMIELTDAVRNCLTSPNESLDELIRHFVKQTTKSELAIEDFPHLELDRSALQQCLHGTNTANAHGINFLFYGDSGTGKTEFSKLLAHTAGFNLYEIAYENSDGEPLSREGRLASLTIAQRFLASKPNSILLFDEIEDVFPSSYGNFWASLFGGETKETTSPSKAWINRCLESNKIPVIWISNAIKQIDPAYLRRFTYHLEVLKPPTAVRSRIADKYLSTLPLTASFIQQIAEDSSLTPAQIENAAKFIRLSGITDQKSAEEMTSRVIRFGKRAIGAEHAGARGHSSPTQYHLDNLNIDSRYPITKVIQALSHSQASTLCFYGPPGTGKTALAAHIAKSIDKPLLAKRASDILDMYVGGSEKNIAEMFREAENDGAVLFLDEADSLLRDRKSAQHSWEVTQVNEMLQQMERFDGIFICATNLFSDIDQAALRRFSFKLEFKPLRLEQRTRMFVHEALEGDDRLLDRLTLSRLGGLDNLTPGDYAAVKRQLRLMGETVSSQEFMEMLEAECKLKLDRESKHIGFLA